MRVLTQNRLRTELAAVDELIRDCSAMIPSLPIYS